MVQWTVQLGKYSDVEEKQENKRPEQVNQRCVETRGLSVLGNVGSEFVAGWRDNLGFDLPSQRAALGLFEAWQLDRRQPVKDGRLRS